jgi:hypothetical protein
MFTPVTLAATGAAISAANAFALVAFLPRE